MRNTDDSGRMLRLTAASRLAAALLLMLMLACSREEATLNPHYLKQAPPGDGKTHYTFAVHPLQNPQLLHRKFQPLMHYLSSQIPNTEFDLEASSDYADYERKLRAGSSEFSLPNPYHAVLARDWGYHVIAKMGNDALFRGIFIVRKDSPIRVPTDLRGKVVSYPAPTALAAAMMPQLYLQNHGIDVATELTNRYVGTHNSAIMNAYLGQSAIAATWPAAWEAFQTANPHEASELYVIWQTPPLIQNAIVARNDLPQDIVLKVRQLLVSLQGTPAGRDVLKNIDTLSFEAADDRQFDVVQEFLKEFDAKLGRHK